MVQKEYLNILIFSFLQTLSKKTIRGWAMYDWANSAYALVVSSTIFPAYYNSVTTSANAAGTELHTVRFLGVTLESAALYNYALAFACLVVAFLSPILSSIADYKGNKKSFMKFFCYLGSLACCSMFWFKADTLWLGITCCILAAIGFTGSLVFYNSYLPEIAHEKDMDRVSAQGFAYGYMGSVILQLFCLLLVLKQNWFGISDNSLPARLSFLLVGVWWMSFAQITFYTLPKSIITKEKEGNIFTNGFRELNKVWLQVKEMPVLKRFLFAFLFYSMGIQTALVASTLFGSQVLHLTTASLIICILIIQLVAIIGAYVMAKLSSLFGNFPVLIMVLCLWVGICIVAYFVTTANQFYIVAAFVGLVMGGTQSLSRSTYSRIMPETKDTASFFSFYDATEKIAMVVGLFSFGVIQQITGNMRYSIIALVFFFVIGFVLLVLAKRKSRVPALGIA